MACFASDGLETSCELDGKKVFGISSDLRPVKEIGWADLTRALKLKETSGISFQGVVPRGSVNKKKAKELGLPPGSFVLIPTCIDQNPCAHLRRPMDIIFHG